MSKKSDMIAKGSEEWNARFLELVYTYLDIRQCKQCGSPVNDGYSCCFCGTSNPYWTKEQEAAWDAKCEAEAKE